MKQKLLSSVLAAAMLLTGCGGSTDTKKSEAEIKELLENTYQRKFTILNSYMDENPGDADYMCRMNVIPDGHPEYLFTCSCGQKHHSEKSLERLTEMHYAEGILNYQISEQLKDSLSGQFPDCDVRTDLHNEVYWGKNDIDSITAQEYLERALDFNGELNDADYTVLVNTDNRECDADAEFAVISGTLTDISEKLGLSGTMHVYFTGEAYYSQRLEWNKEHLEEPPADSKYPKLSEMHVFTLSYDYDTHEIPDADKLKDDYAAGLQ